MNSLDHQAQLAIQKGSKSFHLASWILPAQSRQGAHLLYAWCRHCDDVVDEAPNQESAISALEHLSSQTEKAYLGHTQLDSHAFQALQVVAKQYGIPQQYPLDMIQGFRLDTLHKPVANERELEFYCYCVAGTVGLMMCHIMGLANERALNAAVKMGMAMQLTNIARDIRQDFKMGRVYLPQSWLDQTGLKASDLGDPKMNEKLFPVVLKLLDKADQYYQEGWQGLNALTFRTAAAISAASEIYRAIGQNIRRKGPSALDSRSHTSLGLKLFLCAWGLGRVLSSLPHRIRHPWRPQAIKNIWRFE